MQRYGQIIAAFLLVVTATGLLQTASAFDLYDVKTLQKANQTYAENIRLVWNEDLLTRLTVSERQAAGNVRLDIPLMGFQKSPFDYYSSPGTREITIPIMSVKFFDDLAIAEAWLTHQGCSIDPVLDYVGILRYQGASLPAGKRLPLPLQALGIPRNALDDPFINDVSGKTLKSTIYFLMAHELAHIIYQHKPYNMISRQKAQAQEVQADAFALNVMRRISVPPMGMVLFFAVCSRFEPAPSDFPNQQEYENFVRKTSTHPLTSQRLITISKSIRSNADAFSRGQNNPALWRPRIIKVADDIEAIGKTLDDRKIRELQKYRSQTIKVGDLRNSCHSR